jgi:DNA-binding MarR family transcriptional regulator
MIDDLERADVAVRQPSQADRRVKTVVLTPRGLTALQPRATDCSTHHPNWPN